MAAVSTEQPAGGSPSSRAAEYLAHDRFHRRFTLPATADHGELQVSYADAGRTPPRRDDGDGDGDGGTHHPTVLFIPGMFASRYLSVWMHAVAERLGVRVLVVDRPGMGHSTDVPLHQRITTWVELVPRLLEHLQIEHVALAAHSSGTLYLLNTLTRCRDILDPERPLVALVAPWVDPAHSQVTTMRMAQSLPASVFGIWHHLPKVVSAGGTALSKVASLLPSSSGIGATETAPLERNRQRVERDYGLAVGVQRELQGLTLRSMVGEDMVGADSEALCCLRKGPAGLWGDCEDYAVFVRELLVGLERSRREGGGGGEMLRVCAYFAESDAMIGKRGQRYMEDCWKGGSEGGEFGDVLRFTTETVRETDHDSVVQTVEVLRKIFLDAGGAMPGSL